MVPPLPRGAIRITFLAFLLMLKPTWSYLPASNAYAIDFIINACLLIIWWSIVKEESFESISILMIIKRSEELMTHFPGKKSKWRRKLVKEEWLYFWLSRWENNNYFSAWLNTNFRSMLYITYLVLLMMTYPFWSETKSLQFSFFELASIPSIRWDVDKRSNREDIDLISEGCRSLVKYPIIVWFGLKYLLYFWMRSSGPILRPRPPRSNSQPQPPNPL